MQLSRIKILDDGELEQIHQTSLRILEEIGIKIMSESARDLLQKLGAEKKDNNYLKIPREIINKYLSKVPSSFSIYGVDKSYKVEINTEDTIFGTQGAPTHITDEENPRKIRNIYLNDTINHLKIVSQLQNLSISHLDAWPTELSNEIFPHIIIREWARYSKKPFGVPGYGKDLTQKMLETTELVVGGRKELQKYPRLLAFFNSISPLVLDKRNIEGLINHCNYSQPIIISTAAAAGLSAPVTMAGLISQVNAEMLASITLTQIINPGNPILYGCVNSPMDPITGNISWGAVETSLITIAMAQLAKFYKIPSRALGGGTDAKTLDMQNGIERFMNLYSAAMAGINYITIAGTYETGLSYCPELLIIDDELVGMVKRAITGIQVNENTLAFDQLKKLVNRKNGNFMNLRHTSKNMRTELYISDLMVKETRKRWEKGGEEDLVNRARRKAQEILHQDFQSHLDPKIEQLLQNQIDYINLGNRDNLKHKGGKVT